MSSSGHLIAVLAVVGLVAVMDGRAAAEPAGAPLTAPRTGILVVAPDAGLAAPVVVFARPGGTEAFRFFPYDSRFRGGVRVAVGDVNGDGTPDVITGPARGAPPLVRVFDGATGAPLSGPLGSFLAYDAKFSGGVFVAAGDVDGDGKADVITGTGKGAPHVKVFNAADGSVLRSFFAYDPGFHGGVRVAAGDVNGDRVADLVTGPGKGKEGPHVKVFDGATLGVLADFYPFDPLATGGVYVAVGDVDGDQNPDVVTGPEKNGDPHVRAFTATGVPLASFFPYDRAFRGGVRVAVGDVNGAGRAEIVTGPGKGDVGPRVAIFDATTNGGSAAPEVVPFDRAFTGGVFVAAGN